MLLRLFDWNNLSIQCYTLFIDSKHHPTEYSFESPNPHYYFQINNVGNDKALLSRIKNREKWIWNSGFHKIIGLRDMYSKEYREEVKNATIDGAVNQLFIDAHQEEINKFSNRPHDIFFNFSIMEIESWILGFGTIFEKMNPLLTSQVIKQSIGYYIEEVDPQHTFFHPSVVLDRIFQTVNQQYDKKKGDISAILSYIEKDDYLNLYNKSICESFNKFYDSLGLPNFNL